jgi:hypothetical protein
MTSQNIDLSSWNILYMIELGYVTTEMKLTVAGRALLVNEY